MADQERVAHGLVAGRFQPLHLGHMEYIFAALKRCSHLYVGITHPDPEKYFFHEADSHRSTPSANPFPYTLRKQMVEELMTDLRVNRDEFDVVPVRLENPIDCRRQVPLGTTVFVTIYDQWGEAKKDLFERMGFRVEILWRRRETVTRGHSVRAKIREGAEWEHLVPSSTQRVVQGWINQGNGNAGFLASLGRE